jgi:hypothetical protein
VTFKPGMINGHSSDREGVTFGDLTRSRELADEEESSEDKCLVHVERHPNGGATVVHLYEEEVAHLPSSRVHGLADVFFRYTLQTCGWVCVMSSALTGRCSRSLPLGSRIM